MATLQQHPVRELKAAEDHYRLLVDTVDDYAIFMLDPKGYVTTWNRGAQRIKGYAASEIIGRHFSTFYSADDVASGKPALELRIASEQGRVEDEGWRVRKDGSRFWANVVLTAIRDASGDLIGFAKITRDLTVRREAEQTARDLIAQQAARAAAEGAETRLREEGERYRDLSRRLTAILESVADCMTVQDRAGHLLFANSAAAKACGFEAVADLLAATPGEIVSRFDILDEHGNPFDPEQLPGRKALRNGEAATALMRVRAVGKEDVWFAVRSSAVIGSDGTPELAVNIWQDVSEKNRRERHERYLSMATVALSSSLEYTTMLSTLADLLVPSLADWCAVHLVNGDSLENVAVAHVDPAKVEVTREHQRCLSPDSREVEGLWAVIRTGQTQTYEAFRNSLGMASVIIAPVMIRDRVCGTITLASTNPMRRYNAHAVALVEEIGRRTGVAIENAKLYEAEKEASRIKEEFLATVSHELRTPLNAIVGWSSLLRGGSTGAELAKGLEVIHRNALAQAKIIEDILDVSRIVAGKLRLDLQRADLTTAIRNAIEVIEPSALAKRISINFEMPEDPCVLVADHERLQQVMWNLLSNAVKFTDAGGAIGVEVQREGSKLTVSIADTGRGIDPEFLPHVFDRFKQADGTTTRRFGGLGLGLAIVRHIVELHGGQVQADSAGLGHGSVFRIHLPVQAAAPMASQTDQLAAQRGQRLTDRRLASLDWIRVLVVDDESDARDLLHAVLVQAGASVETAGSAAEGLIALRRFRPHVLVSDIGMPDEDGYAFMRRVRALDSGDLAKTPSIALTAYSRGADRASAFAAGFTTHVGKPVNPDELAATVARLASRA